MKAVFITFDQAHYERIIDILDRQSCRGFTAWPQVSGRGSRDGEPHYGSHAWPSLAQAIMTVVEDSRLQRCLLSLRLSTTSGQNWASAPLSCLWTRPYSNHAEYTEGT